MKYISTACKAYLSYIICKTSVNSATIPYKTEVHMFAGEYAGRGAQKPLQHRIMMVF